MLLTETAFVMEILVRFNDFNPLVGHIKNITFSPGGPLISVVDGVQTLVGVNSYVQTSSCIGDVQGFTRVDHYLDWISAYTGLYISW